MKALARYLTEKYIYIDSMVIYSSYRRIKTSTISGGKLFYQYKFLSRVGQLGRLGCMGYDEV